MEFIIKITTGGWNRGFSFGVEEIGIEGLDFIRKETGVEKLKLEKIQGYIQSQNSDPEFVIDEEIARNSGLFQNKNKVYIHCKRNFMNQFVEKVVKIIKSEKSGKIKKAWITRQLNEEKVIAAWVQAGYPEYWECEKED